MRLSFAIAFLSIFITSNTLAAPLPEQNNHQSRPPIGQAQEFGTSAPPAKGWTVRLGRRGNQGGTSIPPGHTWRRRSANNDLQYPNPYNPSSPSKWNAMVKAQGGKSDSSKKDKEKDVAPVATSAKTEGENVQILRRGVGGVSVPPPGMNWRKKRSPAPHGGGVEVPPGKNWLRLPPTLANAGVAGAAMNKDGKGKHHAGGHRRSEMSSVIGPDVESGSEDATLSNEEMLSLDRERIARADDTDASLDSSVEEQSVRGREW
ncbi:hypothetical protein FRB98_008490 [Tulasnella sp. 332]|nr:hypothetical protein FRB98_008490 [Tulasnella sp. 332]